MKSVRPKGRTADVDLKEKEIKKPLNSLSTSLTSTPTSPFAVAWQDLPQDPCILDIETLVLQTVASFNRPYTERQSSQQKISLLFKETMFNALRQGAIEALNAG